MSAGLLLIRLVVGVLLAGHGTQKLFGWLGGYGIEGTGQFFEGIGFRPGKTFAALAGLSETLGGLLFLLGFVQPLAAMPKTPSCATSPRSASHYVSSTNHQVKRGHAECGKACRLPSSRVRSPSLRISAPAGRP